MEVVLPTFYYVVLVAELAGLLYFYSSPGNDVRASGHIGHAIGWVGTLSMCVMHVYSIRRSAPGCTRTSSSGCRARCWCASIRRT